MFFLIRELFMCFLPETKVKADGRRGDGTKNMTDSAKRKGVDQSPGLASDRGRDTFFLETGEQ